MVKEVRAAFNQAETEEFLIMRANEPGLSTDERHYREYARDFGIIMSRAIFTRDGSAMICMAYALCDTLGVATGNIAATLEDEGPAFVSHMLMKVGRRIAEATHDVQKKIHEVKGRT